MFARHQNMQRNDKTYDYFIYNVKGSDLTKRVSKKNIKICILMEIL